MKKLLTAINAATYVVEIVFPSVTFLIVFILFVAGVVMRYVFKSPSTWMYEGSLIAFLWTVNFAVCTSERNEDHIVFSMIYDRCSPRVRNIMRILSNTLIAVILGIALKPSLHYLLRNKGKTSFLRISLIIVFSCYILMFFISTIRFLARAIEDMKSFKSRTYVQRYNVGEKANPV